MGVTLGKRAAAAAAEERNLVIDKELQDSKAKERKTIKLLLLGAAECGKTTILKQFRLLHANGFSEEEILHQRQMVFQNSVDAIYTLLQAMTHFNITLKHFANKDSVHLVMKMISQGEEVTEMSAELKEAIKSLWKDPGVQEAFGRRNEFQISDNAKYFLDQTDRIGLSDYRPTELDILHTRVKTTSIVEINFEWKSIYFRVFDVGGQQSQRKKWIHCFENVSSVIFITSLSEFDQKLEEDNVTNRMKESVRLFTGICNSEWFKKTSMILFLNKKDLFAEKIRSKSISVCFPEYEGSNSYADNVDFVREKFESQNKTTKPLYIHETCATDTFQVQFVLNSTMDTIMSKHMKGFGLY